MMKTLLLNLIFITESFENNQYKNLENRDKNISRIPDKKKHYQHTTTVFEGST